MYGTLMSGFDLNGFLTRDKGEKVRDAELDEFDLYVVLGEGYPYIIPGKGRVKGEIWDIPRNRLRTIDIVENVSSKLYRREGVTTVDGTECHAYVWGGKDFPAAQIDHGDFRRYYREATDINRQ
ncbi:MAG: gamma-glutamylcyclotransferase family protein [Candidatus Aenigmatarchaeota archaeon]